MALFGKDEKVQRPDDARPAFINSPVLPGEPTPTTTEPQVQAQLGKGSRIEGKLSFDGSVRIDGQVEGEIQAQEAVIIGESAVVNAQVSAGTLILTGRLTGDVVARKRVELRAPGRLTGNINTPCLVIHEGVVFEGRCSMTAAAPAAAATATASSSTASAAERSAATNTNTVAQFPREERAAAAGGRTDVK
jgi:cytoskeletal protein CcmA (bactofilin family)